MEIYHTCTENPAHKAWGIYERHKNAEATKPFELSTMCFNYKKAVDQANTLSEQFPKKDFSVQGAALSGQLPEKYTI